MVLWNHWTIPLIIRELFLNSKAEAVSLIAHVKLKELYRRNSRNPPMLPQTYTNQINNTTDMPNFILTFLRISSGYDILSIIVQTKLRHFQVGYAVTTF